MEIRQRQSDVTTGLCLSQSSACHLRFLQKWHAPPIGTNYQTVHRELLGLCAARLLTQSLFQSSTDLLEHLTI